MKDLRRFLSLSYRPVRAAGLAALRIALSPAAHAAVTETTLHAFSGTDGSTPNASLTQLASDTRNFFGTTLAGSSAGSGTAYKLAISPL